MPQHQRQDYRELREEEIDAILQKLEAFVSDPAKRANGAGGGGGFGCIICESPDRNQISRMLLHGVGYRTVEKAFKPISWRSIFKHYKNHIRPFIPPLENPIAEIAKGISTRTPFPINTAERTQWVWIAHQQMVARQLVVDSLEWQDPEMCKLAISMARAYSAVIAQIGHAIPNLRKIDAAKRKGKSDGDIEDLLTDKQKHELRIAKKYRDYRNKALEVTAHVGSGRTLEKPERRMGPAAPKPKEETDPGASEPSAGAAGFDDGGLREVADGIEATGNPLGNPDEEAPETHVELDG